MRPSSCRGAFDACAARHPAEIAHPGERDVLGHDVLLLTALRAAAHSDLRAKRRLLALAVIHAFQDDAPVLLDLRFVRLLAELDTVDIRVLVRVETPAPPTTLIGKSALI